MPPPDDLDLIAELDEPTPEQEAIATVLRDIDEAHPSNQVVMDNRTHYPGCWMLRDHADCLAARIRRTLEGTDHDR